MISIRKLQTLPPDTRIRKTVRLLDSFVRYRKLPDPGYLRGLLRIIGDQLPDIGLPAGNWTDPSIRMIDDLRHRVRRVLNIPSADWDFLPPAGYGTREAEYDVSSSGAGRISVFLESIRSPFNVGSIIRTAASLGRCGILLTPDCPDTNHPRVVRTARGAERSVEIRTAALEEIEAMDAPLIALEPGGEDLESFTFPARGILLVGSEELGLSTEARACAQAVVSIPMVGPKGSLNVGVACGIALHAWWVQTRMTDTGE